MTHSPTCIVQFADGEVTRMTVWSEDGRPDLRRGIMLARFTYESRTKHFTPAISAVHFEIADGDTVTTTKFTTEQIVEATAKARIVRNK